MNSPLLEWGTGDRTLLLLHGISSNKEGWWRVGPALAELGYHVAAVDLRGHGANSHPESMQLIEYVGDILEVVGPVDVLMGHSLGGAVALTLLAEKPDFCDRLILEDPALLLGNSPEVIEWLTAEFDKEGEITAESVHASSPGWHPTDAAHKADALNQSGREAVLRTLNSNPDINLMAQLLGIAQPTLLIGASAEGGAIVPPALGQGVVALNPNVEFHTIPNSSHSIHRDECDAMMRVIEEWLVAGSL